MPSHITRIGNSATTGAERKGSISGDNTALIRGAAPIKMPTGMPITTTSNAADNTRPIDHKVAVSNRLSPSCQDKYPSACSTLHGAGSLFGPTSPVPDSRLQTSKTAATAPIPNQRRVAAGRFS